MSVTLRPLLPDDKPQWAALWRGYLEFYETELPQAHYDLQFDRLLSDDANEYSCIVAEDAGQLVGLAHYLFHRHGWYAADVCYLQDLYVAPEARRGGTARALIEAVYAEADRAGAANVYWMTQQFNANARRLYDQIGHLTPFLKYNRT